jgi:hypothetical protein
MRILITNDDGIYSPGLEALATVAARAAELYAVVADYRAGHPAILPKAYFQELTVEKGGAGAGTVVRASVKVMGRIYPVHDSASCFSQFKVRKSIRPTPLRGSKFATKLVRNPREMSTLERIV